MENMGLPTCRGCGGFLACTCASDKADLTRKLEVAREALRGIGAFYDKVANQRLENTGSFSGFDEPTSVEISRKALKEIDA